MHIHIVSPVTTPGLSQLSDFEPMARDDVEISHSILESGPPTVESLYDEVLAMPGTVARIVASEQSGADAALIDCMGDPGLGAAREATSMLVLGPAQTSMHVAAMLAQNFSIVTTMDSVVPLLRDLARQYGLSEKLCSIRSVQIPVLDLHDGDRLVKALVEQSIRAVEDDGAHAIVFGCTGMRGCAEAIRDRLDEAGHGGIPVIDPLVTTLKVAEALVDLGLRPSTRTYPTPRLTGLSAKSFGVAT